MYMAAWCAVLAALPPICLALPVQFRRNVLGQGPQRVVQRNVEDLLAGSVGLGDYADLCVLSLVICTFAKSIRQVLYSHPAGGEYYHDDEPWQVSCQHIQSTGV